MDDWFQKNELKKRGKLTKKYFESGKRLQLQITALSNECIKTVLEAKERYISQLSQKLIEPSTEPKTYWKIINCFVNNKTTPIIPPLLVNNKIIPNFFEKANLFNKFCASQCNPLENNSSLPPFCLKPENHLLSFEISETDIFAIIKNLDPNKSHGWDNLSIRMIKLCGKSITYTLKLIFEALLKEGTFLSCWKNLILCHCTKSKIKLTKKTTDLLVYCQFLEKYLRKYFSKIYWTTFIKIRFLQNAGLDFYLVILAYHSCYLLFTIPILLLTVFQLLMSVVYS